MRTRTEIINDYDEAKYDTKLLLEVLLDVREILNEIKEED